MNHGLPTWTLAECEMGEVQALQLRSSYGSRLLACNFCTDHVNKKVPG